MAEAICRVKSKTYVCLEWWAVFSVSRELVNKIEGNIVESSLYD